MSKLLKFSILISFVLLLFSCINDRLSTNYFWQHGKIELPDGYDIVSQKSTQDSSIVILKLNQELTLNIKNQIIINEKYLDSMFVNDPDTDISKLFEGQNWGRYNSGYYYQSSIKNIVCVFVKLDTVNHLISYKHKFVEADFVKDFQY